MKDPKIPHRKSDQQSKTERLAEALRANLNKRKALARIKKSRSGGEATEMPHKKTTEDGEDGNPSEGNDCDPLRRRPTRD